MPHPNPNDKINREAGQPGSEDGVYLDDLADGAVLELETKHHHYTIVKSAHTQARIAGHPSSAPNPSRWKSMGLPGEGSR
jgi:hypothetical protein